MSGGKDLRSIANAQIHMLKFPFIRKTHIPVLPCYVKWINTTSFVLKHRDSSDVDGQNNVKLMCLTEILELNVLNEA